MYAYTARIMFSKKDDVQHTQIVLQPQLERIPQGAVVDPPKLYKCLSGFIPTMGCSCTVLSHSLPPSSTPAHAAGGGRPQLTDLTSAEHLLEGGTGGRS